MSRNISRLFALLLVAFVSECWAIETLAFSPPIPSSGEPFMLHADFNVPILACSRSRKSVVVPSAGALNVAFWVTCAAASTPTTFSDTVVVSGLPAGSYFVNTSLLLDVAFGTPLQLASATGTVQVVPVPIPTTSPKVTGGLAVLLAPVGMVFLLRSRRNFRQAAMSFVSTA